MDSFSISRARGDRSFGVRVALIAAASLAAILVISFAAFEARAQGSTVQGVPNAMQGFSQNRDKPIQIDAGSLELRDKDKAATFKDNVKVVQGDTTMRCKTLVVFYDGGGSSSGASGTPKSTTTSTMTSATPGPGGSSSIRRLEAKGGVIVTQKDQTVTGDTGEFDMKSNTVTMRGNVILTRGDSVLRGDTLVVDMTTGVSKVESKTKVQVLLPSAGKGGGSTSLFPGNNSGEPAAPIAPAGRPSASGGTGKPMNLNDLTGSGKR